MNRTRTTALALCCALLLGSTGCTYAKIRAGGKTPIIMTTVQGKSTRIKASKLYAFDYTNTYEIDDILADDGYLNMTDSLSDVRIHVKRTPLTFIINLFTLGLAFAREVEVRAEWHKRS